MIYMIYMLNEESTLQEVAISDISIEGGSGTACNGIFRELCLKGGSNFTS